MRQVALAVVFSLGSGAAVAQVTCDWLLSMTAQNAPVQMMLESSGAEATCTQSLMLSGGAQLHCGWSFAYRTPEALSAFNGLTATVRACLGPVAAVTDDLDVNHPDFYDLQTFQFGDREVGVSLKDKAALSQTCVFLRVTLPE